MTPPVLATIGATPLVGLEGVWCKLEHRNPSGSLKARLAAALVARAEATGELSPGDTIVEASSGNTANALAMVAAAKGYGFTAVMPAGLSPERAAITRAYGGHVRHVGDFHVDAALAEASRLGDQPGWYCPQQFDCEANVACSHAGVGAEIVAGLPPGVAPDALVTGVGTGGTLAGVGAALREANPACRLVAVEPAESPTLASGTVAAHALEGIADGFVPGIVARRRDLVDELAAVDSAAALAEARRLALAHGLLVGPVTGAHLLAARRVRDELGAGSCVVTLATDAGEKYLAARD